MYIMASVKLNRLSEDVVRQIAAGEVIERPASVVKELLDNSIDAGASKITIKVKNGGIDLIEVSDDGIGIPKENLEGIFESHTTSKLNNIEDALYKIENGTYSICDICHQQIDKDRLDILPETNLCSNCAKNQPDLHLTSREENQRLIN